MSARPCLWLDIRVEPGADIERVCASAVEVAKRLNVIVWFVFNNVTVCARPDDQPGAVADAWQRALLSNHQFKIAAANT